MSKNKAKLNGVSTQKTKIDKYFYDNEVEKLLNSIDDLTSKAIIVTGLELGLRASELVGIIESNIDYENQTILIWDEKKDEWRTVTGTKQYFAFLKMYANSRSKKDKLIFPISTRTVSRIVQRYTKQANIMRGELDLSKHVSSHWLRHTFVRLSRKAGRDIKLVQAQTGDTLLTLLKYYADLSIEDRIKEMEGKKIVDY